MDVVQREVYDLPVFALEQADHARFGMLSKALLESYTQHQRPRVRRGAQIATTEQQFDVLRSLPIIEAIDAALAEHYGLSSAEQEWIRQYDRKYRLGRRAAE